MDALVLARKTAEIVSRGSLRKYYRFRWAPYYGGIATADCVGCCLRCVYCWSWNIVNRPEASGKFYTPDHVARELTRIARRKSTGLIRISGNEPTINREHLTGVLSSIQPQFTFILETNGIILGADRAYCDDLAQFPNIHVRVSLKGACPEEFHRVTGLDPSGFEYQIRSIENLVDAGVRVHPALMSCMCSPGAIQGLRARLGEVDPSLADIEEEELILYPAVEARMKQKGFQV
ncbi:MAG: radical SAM protein [Desulfomonilia bacterium]